MVIQPPSLPWSSKGAAVRQHGNTVNVNPLLLLCILRETTPQHQAIRYWYSCLEASSTPAQYGSTASRGPAWAPGRPRSGCCARGAGRRDAPARPRAPTATGCRRMNGWPLSPLAPSVAHSPDGSRIIYTAERIGCFRSTPRQQFHNFRDYSFRPVFTK